MRLLKIAALISILLIGCCTVITRQPQIIQIKPTDIVENVIKTSCKITWYKGNKRLKSGSANCIGKRGNTYYLLTARHVAILPLTIKDIMKSALVGELNDYRIEVTIWQYDKRGYDVKAQAYAGTVVWLSGKTDAAIISITGNNIPLNVAQMATAKEYEQIQIGHIVMKAGCPSGLAPMYIRGYLSRFNVEITKFNLLVDVYILHTHAGDSGSCLFLASSNKIIAISCLGKTHKITYFCGAIPVKSFFEELLQTDLKFLVPTESGG